MKYITTYNFNALIELEDKIFQELLGIFLKKLKMFSEVKEKVSQHQ